MEIYNPKLKELARSLRREQTPAEECLWQFLRRKQILGAQFYRQKPLLTYIVDLYCPTAKLFVEPDGQLHFEADGRAKDRERDELLTNLNLQALRFENKAFLHDTDTVILAITAVVQEHL